MPSTYTPPPPPPPIPNFQFETLKRSEHIKIENFENNVPDECQKLPQQTVPKSNYKLKQITWSKIPSVRIFCKDNLWTKFEQNELSIFDSSFFSDMEQLFYVENGHKFDTDRRDSTLIRESRMLHSADKINLLDSKKSLNINIFLKQFRCDSDEICNNLLSNNRNQIFGIENLETLLKIIPDSNEIEILKSYKGDVDKLGQAEKFLLKLIAIPNYKLRIECLLVKEEFYNQIFYFNKSFDAILNACKIIYESHNLVHMMLCICKTGNFLNNGSYCGNAAGFKLSSLNKICDLKSNKNNLTLLHLLIQRLDNHKSKLLELPDEILPCLKDVISIQIENFKNDIFVFNNKVRTLYEQLFSLDLPTINDLRDFFKMAILKMNDLKNKQVKFDEWHSKLSNYFCEDPVSFKLEECFSILFNFSEKAKFIIQEIKRQKSIIKTDSLLRQDESTTVKLRHHNNSPLDSKSSNYLEDLDGLVINCVNRISRRSARSRLSHPTGSSNLIKFLNDDIGVNREPSENPNDSTSKSIRRSFSTNQVESTKDENRRLQSMILLEENLDENLEDNKKTNKKWSGLRKVEEFQKLASMYKKFQDEDLNTSIRPKSLIESDNKNKTNLGEKLAFFENKNSVEQNRSSLEFLRESKHRHSSFIFNKTDKNIVSSQVQKFDLLNNQSNYLEIKDEGFETQSNSSSSHTETSGNSKSRDSFMLKEKEMLKRRSVCPIINRSKAECKSMNESRLSMYTSKIDAKKSFNNGSSSIRESQNTKFTNSSSNMYMNETLSTKAKKTSVKQGQNSPMQSQSKSRLVSYKTSDNCKNLKNVSTMSNNTIGSDQIDSSKVRTISSSSSSTLGSQKLNRKNRFQTVLIKNKTLCKNESIDAIKF